MRLWQCPREGRGNPVLIEDLRVQGRHDAIGHEGFQATVLPPFIDRCWVTQELGQENLVVALQTNCLVGSAALDETVKRLPRRRSAVDVIAEEDLDWASDGASGKIRVNLRKE